MHWNWEQVAQGELVMTTSHVLKMKKKKMMIRKIVQSKKKINSEILEMYELQNKMLLFIFMYVDTGSG